MLHAHTRQYQKLKSYFKHNLKSKCQTKSVTMTKQFTYDQTKESNRIKDKKNRNNRKNCRFFCQILQCDYGCDFFGCFDAIIRCDIFPKKTWDAMRFSMRCDCHPCFTLTSDIHKLNTRSCSSDTFYLSRFKTNKLQHSIKFTGVKVWNKIPNEIKNCSLNVVLKKLKTSILDTY